jgi:hypothetical protein
LRVKSVGVPCRSKSFITGKKECEAIKAYLGGFSDGMTGSVLRKQKVSSTGIISGTKQMVGVHTLEKVGVRIATDLGLPNPEDHTSHTMRRSAIIRMVEAGMPISEMKLQTGNQENYMTLTIIFI